MTTNGEGENAAEKPKDAVPETPAETTRTTLADAALTARREDPRTSIVQTGQQSADVQNILKKFEIIGQNAGHDTLRPGFLYGTRGEAMVGADNFGAVLANRDGRGRPRDVNGRPLSNTEIGIAFRHLVQGARDQNPDRPLSDIADTLNRSLKDSGYEATVVRNQDGKEVLVLQDKRNTDRTGQPKEVTRYTPNESPAETGERMAGRVADTSLTVGQRESLVTQGLTGLVGGMSPADRDAFIERYNQRVGDNPDLQIRWNADANPPRMDFVRSAQERGVNDLPRNLRVENIESFNAVRDLIRNGDGNTRPEDIQNALRQATRDMDPRQATVFNAGIQEALRAQYGDAFSIKADRTGQNQSIEAQLSQTPPVRAEIPAGMTMDQAKQWVATAAEIQRLGRENPDDPKAAMDGENGLGRRIANELARLPESARRAYLQGLTDSMPSSWSNAVRMEINPQDGKSLDLWNRNWGPDDVHRTYRSAEVEQTRSELPLPAGITDQDGPAARAFRDGVQNLADPSRRAEALKALQDAYKDLPQDQQQALFNGLNEHFSGKGIQIERDRRGNLEVVNTVQIGPEGQKVDVRLPRGMDANDPRAQDYINLANRIHSGENLDINALRTDVTRFTQGMNPQQTADYLKGLNELLAKNPETANFRLERGTNGRQIDLQVRVGTGDNATFVPVPPGLDQAQAKQYGELLTEIRDNTSPDGRGVFGPPGNLGERMAEFARNLPDDAARRQFIQHSNAEARSRRWDTRITQPRDGQGIEIKQGDQVQRFGRENLGEVVRGQDADQFFQNLPATLERLQTDLSGLSPDDAARRLGEINSQLPESLRGKFEIRLNADKQPELVAKAPKGDVPVPPGLTRAEAEQFQSMAVLAQDTSGTNLGAFSNRLYAAVRGVDSSRQQTFLDALNPTIQANRGDHYFEMAGTDMRMRWDGPAMYNPTQDTIRANDSEVVRNLRDSGLIPDRISNLDQILERQRALQPGNAEALSDFYKTLTASGLNAADQAKMLEAINKGRTPDQQVRLENGILSMGEGDNRVRVLEANGNFVRLPNGFNDQQIGQLRNLLGEMGGTAFARNNSRQILDLLKGQPPAERDAMIADLNQSLRRQGSYEVIAAHPTDGITITNGERGITAHTSWIRDTGEVARPEARLADALKRLGEGNLSNTDANALRDDIANIIRNHPEAFRSAVQGLMDLASTPANPGPPEITEAARADAIKQLKALYDMPAGTVVRETIQRALETTTGPNSLNAAREIGVDRFHVARAETRDLTRQLDARIRAALDLDPASINNLAPIRDSISRILAAGDNATVRTEAMQSLLRSLRDSGLSPEKQGLLVNAITGNESITFRNGLLQVGNDHAMRMLTAGTNEIFVPGSMSEADATLLQTVLNGITPGNIGNVAREVRDLLSRLGPTTELGTAVKSAIQLALGSGFGVELNPGTDGGITVTDAHGRSTRYKADGTAVTAQESIRQVLADLSAAVTARDTTRVTQLLSELQRQPQTEIRKTIDSLLQSGNSLNDLKALYESGDQATKQLIEAALSEHRPEAGKPTIQEIAQTLGMPAESLQRIELRAAAKEQLQPVLERLATITSPEDAILAIRDATRNIPANMVEHYAAVIRSAVNLNSRLAGMRVDVTPEGIAASWARPTPRVAGLGIISTAEAADFRVVPVNLEATRIELSRLGIADSNHQEIMNRLQDIGSANAEIRERGYRDLLKALSSADIKDPAKLREIARIFGDQRLTFNPATNSLQLNIDGEPPLNLRHVRGTFSGRHFYIPANMSPTSVINVTNMLGGLAGGTLGPNLAGMARELGRLNSPEREQLLSEFNRAIAFNHTFTNPYRVAIEGNNLYVENAGWFGPPGRFPLNPEASPIVHGEIPKTVTDLVTQSLNDGTSTAALERAARLGDTERAQFVEELMRQARTDGSKEAATRILAQLASTDNNLGKAVRERLAASALVTGDRSSTVAVLTRLAQMEHPGPAALRLILNDIGRLNTSGSGAEKAKDFFNALGTALIASGNTSAAKAFVDWVKAAATANPTGVDITAQASDALRAIVSRFGTTAAGLEALGLTRGADGAIQVGRHNIRLEAAPTATVDARTINDYLTRKGLGHIPEAQRAKTYQAMVALEAALGNPPRGDAGAALRQLREAGLSPAHLTDVIGKLNAGRDTGIRIKEDGTALVLRVAAGKDITLPENMTRAQIDQLSQLTTALRSANPDRAQLTTQIKALLDQMSGPNRTALVGEINRILTNPAPAAPTDGFRIRLATNGSGFELHHNGTKVGEATLGRPPIAPVRDNATMLADLASWGIRGVTDTPPGRLEQVHRAIENLHREIRNGHSNIGEFARALKALRLSESQMAEVARHVNAGLGENAIRLAPDGRLTIKVGNQNLTIPDSLSRMQITQLQTLVGQLHRATEGDARAYGERLKAILNSVSAADRGRMITELNAFLGDSTPPARPANIKFELNAQGLVVKFNDRPVGDAIALGAPPADQPAATGELGLTPQQREQFEQYRRLIFGPPQLKPPPGHSFHRALQQRARELGITLPKAIHDALAVKLRDNAFAASGLNHLTTRDMATISDADLAQIIKDNAAPAGGEVNMRNLMRMRPEQLRAFLATQEGSNFMRARMESTNPQDRLSLARLLHTKGITSFTVNGADGQPITMRIDKADVRVPGRRGTVSQYTLGMVGADNNITKIAQGTFDRRGRFTNDRSVTPPTDGKFPGINWGSAEMKIGDTVIRPRATAAPVEAPIARPPAEQVSQYLRNLGITFSGDANPDRDFRVYEQIERAKLDMRSGRVESVRALLQSLRTAETGRTLAGDTIAKVINALNEGAGTTVGALSLDTNGNPRLRIGTGNTERDFITIAPAWNNAIVQDLSNLAKTNPEIAKFKSALLMGLPGATDQRAILAPLLAQFKSDPAKMRAALVEAIKVIRPTNLQQFAEQFSAAMPEGRLRVDNGQLVVEMGTSVRNEAERTFRISPENIAAAPTTTDRTQLAQRALELFNGFRPNAPGQINRNLANILASIPVGERQAFLFGADGRGGLRAALRAANPAFANIDFRLSQNGTHVEVGSSRRVVPSRGGEAMARDEFTAFRGRPALIGDVVPPRTGDRTVTGGDTVVVRPGSLEDFTNQMMSITNAHDGRSPRSIMEQFTAFARGINPPDRAKLAEAFQIALVTEARLNPTLTNQQLIDRIKPIVNALPGGYDVRITGTAPAQNISFTDSNGANPVSVSFQMMDQVRQSAAERTTLGDTTTMDATAIGNSLRDFLRATPPPDANAITARLTALAAQINTFSGDKNALVGQISRILGTGTTLRIVGNELSLQRARQPEIKVPLSATPPETPEPAALERLRAMGIEGLAPALVNRADRAIQALKTALSTPGQDVGAAMRALRALNIGDAHLGRVATALNRGRGATEIQLAADGKSLVIKVGEKNVTIPDNLSREQMNALNILARTLPNATQENSRPLAERLKAILDGVSGPNRERLVSELNALTPTKPPAATEGIKFRLTTDGKLEVKFNQTAVGDLITLAAPPVEQPTATALPEMTPEQRAQFDILKRLLELGPLSPPRRKSFYQAIQLREAQMRPPLNPPLTHPQRLALARMLNAQFAVNGHVWMSHSTRAITGDANNVNGAGVNGDANLARLVRGERVVEPSAVAPPADRFRDQLTAAGQILNGFDRNAPGTKIQDLANIFNSIPRAEREAFRQALQARLTAAGRQNPALSNLEIKLTNDGRTFELGQRTPVYQRIGSEIALTDGPAPPSDAIPTLSAEQARNYLRTNFGITERDDARAQALYRAIETTKRDMAAGRVDRALAMLGRLRETLPANGRDAILTRVRTALNQAAGNGNGSIEIQANNTLKMKIGERQLPLPAQLSPALIQDLSGLARRDAPRAGLHLQYIQARLANPTDHAAAGPHLKTLLSTPQIRDNPAHLREALIQAYRLERSLNAPSSPLALQTFAERFRAHMPDGHTLSAESGNLVLKRADRPDITITPADLAAPATIDRPVNGIDRGALTRALTDASVPPEKHEEIFNRMDALRTAADPTARIEAYRALLRELSLANVPARKLDQIATAFNNPNILRFNETTQSLMMPGSPDINLIHVRTTSSGIFSTTTHDFYPPATLSPAELKRFSDITKYLADGNHLSNKMRQISEEVANLPVNVRQQYLDEINRAMQLGAGTNGDPYRLTLTGNSLRVENLGWMNGWNFTRTQFDLPAVTALPSDATITPQLRQAIDNGLALFNSSFNPNRPGDLAAKMQEILSTLPNAADRRRALIAISARLRSTGVNLGNIRFLLSGDGNTFTLGRAA